jgi:hypothetical protein
MCAGACSFSMTLCLPNLHAVCKLAGQQLSRQTGSMEVQSPELHISRLIPTIFFFVGMLKRRILFHGSLEF